MSSCLYSTVSYYLLKCNIEQQPGQDISLFKSTHGINRAGELSLIHIQMCIRDRCMYHLKIRASDLQAKMKTVLEPINLNFRPLFNPFFRHNGYLPRRVNLKKYDLLVHEYRLLTKEHCFVNDHYGIHLVFTLYMIVFSLLVTSYGSWKCASNGKCYEINVYILVLKAISDLATMALIAIISESTSAKVNNLFSLS